MQFKISTGVVQWIGQNPVWRKFCLNYAIAIVIVIVVVFHAIPAMYGDNSQPDLRSQIASGLGKLGWVGKPDQ